MKIKFLLLILYFLTDIYPQINSDSLATRNIVLDSLKQDTSAIDTIGLLGDSLKISKKDTLAPLLQTPFYSGSSFIPNKRIVMLDYRYTADFLEVFPFTFILDKGFIGQRNEVVIYGTRFNSISYFLDGVLFNDRYSNSLDLNHTQSESIDSIEIIPAPRGFLYGPVNNAVSVNLITKDFISKIPYSRIKYYEGPFGEAMFDGVFSAMLFNKLNFFADITNRKTDESFENSSYSIWQASARLKYLLSNKLNLSGSYNFVHSETGLNGGIDVDSISRITANIDSLLYDERLAPVIYPTALQKNKQHHFNLRILWNPTENLKTDLNLYYKFYLDEKDNLENHVEDIELLNTSIKSKILGVFLKENFNYGIFNSQINFNYEYHDYLVLDKIGPSLTVPDNAMIRNSFSHNIFSVSPVISILSFDSKLIFSVFYKYYKKINLNVSLPALNGAGIDVSYKFNSKYSFYLGYSGFEFIQNFENIETIEAGARYSEKNIFFDLRFYNREIPYGLISSNFEGRPIINSNISGIGIGAEINLWKIQLESQLNIPGKETFYNQFQLRGGVFYKDVLFDSSLALKTGFAVYRFSRQELITRIPIKTGSSKPRIDFTLAGEIQNSAIVYFAWENLLNENYYIVPYYPMPERSIRFGIAWEIFN